MKKKPKERWVEVGRKELGLYLFADGRSPQTFNYYQLVYEVTESSGQKKKNGPVEFRKRIDYGKCIYQHEHPQTAEMFKIAAVAFGELTRAARRKDKEN